MAHVRLKSSVWVGCVSNVSYVSLACAVCVLCVRGACEMSVQSMGSLYVMCPIIDAYCTHHSNIGRIPHLPLKHMTHTAHTTHTYDTYRTCRSHIWHIPHSHIWHIPHSPITHMTHTAHVNKATKKLIIFLSSYRLGPPATIITLNKIHNTNNKIWQQKLSCFLTVSMI